MEEKPIKRLYYSISEVSRITGLRPYVLRYWETEFSELNPAKNRAGNRTYRKSDIKTVFLIKRLLYQEKYTIEGARQKLKQFRTGKAAQMELSLTDKQCQKLLIELKNGLQQCLDLLQESKKKPY